MKSPRPTAVPKPMQAIYDAVVALTDAFCRDHLTGEYRDLARAMTASLSRKRPSPLALGQPRTWACGIIHVLGQLNFLSDKASQPHMTVAEVCTAFGVGHSTASAKARVISDALHTNRMDPTWMLKRIVDQNPLVWMVKVNGLFVASRRIAGWRSSSVDFLGLSRLGSRSEECITRAALQRPFFVCVVIAQAETVHAPLDVLLPQATGIRSEERMVDHHRSAMVPSPLVGSAPKPRHPPVPTWPRLPAEVSGVASTCSVPYLDIGTEHHRNHCEGSEGGQSPPSKRLYSNALD
jgi:Domain of unknown function (DUF6398)